MSLTTVWVSQWLSVKREYRKALENLKSEVNTNIKNAAVINVWIDANLESLQKGQLVAATCPHLYESAWLSARGTVSTKDYELAVKIENAYNFIATINDFIHTTEELKWGAGSAMAGAVSRDITVFKAMKETVNNGVLPHLLEVKTILSKRHK